MVDATQILGELLGGGNRGRGSLTSGSGAKGLEDLLGIGSGQSGSDGGSVFGGGDQQTGGGEVRGGQSQGGGGIFGGGDRQAGNQRQTPPASGGLDDLLGRALKELTGQKSGATAGAPGSGANNPFDTPQAPQISQNQKSEVYIRAMVQAGLADGRLDNHEQQAILQKIGNVGQAESDFIRAEMAKGSDVSAFIQTVPRGIEEDIYALSLMVIQLDNRNEAQYLDALARGLRITEAQSNAIHDRLGAQRLYS